MWEYIVKEDCIEKFRMMYEPKGDWVKLFKKDKNYLKTELIRDLNYPARFISIDYWKSKSKRDSFKRKFKKEFTVLDKRGGELTINENLIGEFEMN